MNKKAGNKVIFYTTDDKFLREFSLFIKFKELWHT